MIRLPACCSSPRKVQDVRQNNERKQFTLRLLFKPLWLSLFKEGGRVQGGRRKPQGGLGVARSQVGVEAQAQVRVWEQVYVEFSV